MKTLKCYKKTYNNIKTNGQPLQAGEWGDVSIHITTSAKLYIELVVSISRDERDAQSTLAVYSVHGSSENFCNLIQL